MRSRWWRRVFALDCEMVYTTFGVELGRATLVDERGRVALDALVRPRHTLLDCNSRFSGLAREQLLGAAAVSFDACRRQLLALLTADAILVGHGLDGDLRMLRVTRPSDAPLPIAHLIPPAGHSPEGGRHQPRLPAPPRPALQARAEDTGAGEPAEDHPGRR